MPPPEEAGALGTGERGRHWAGRAVEGMLLDCSASAEEAFVEYRTLDLATSSFTHRYSKINFISQTHSTSAIETLDKSFSSSKCFWVATLN